MEFKIGTYIRVLPQHEISISDPKYDLKGIHRVAKYRWNSDLDTVCVDGKTLTYDARRFEKIDLNTLTKVEKVIYSIPGGNND